MQLIIIVAFKWDVKSSQVIVYAKLKN